MENSEQNTTPPTPEPTPAASESAADTQTRQATQELVDELAELANRLTNLGKSWWHSDQRKQIEQDLRTGAESIVTSLESSFHQVASSQEAKELQTKAGEVGEKVATSKVVNDLADALKGGLQALSAQLDKAAQEMEAKHHAQTEASSQPQEDPDTQDIPIDKPSA
jgi:predicted AAA+ superfamily ATPase